jgi:NNP family nitrate/nitrite transporter-like MFS transporter
VSLQAFKKAGNFPTLLSAFLYFDVSFMVWVILGPLGPFIGEAYHLTATQKGLLTAVPLLGGSFCRPILGWSTERFGGRRTSLAGLALTLIPLFIGWRIADDFKGFLGMGLLLGIAGASFAAALPLASSWYPPEHQGLAMGIAGAGNSGTLLSTLFAPRLAQALGWRSVFAIAGIPVLLVWILFFLLAKDAPVHRSVKRWSDYASVLKIADTGWFCLLYCLTFGGFSGLVSHLSIFFHDQYHLSKIQSGDFTTFVVIFGSFLRPIGGMLSDRLGGYRMLLLLLTGASLSLGVIGGLPNVYFALGVLALAMSCLGMGNGSVFQLVPQRFPDRVGIMTGIIGAAGGFGGFLLPSLLGFLKDQSGSYSTGFAALAGLYFLGAGALLYLKNVWVRSWSADAAQRAGIVRESPLTVGVYAGQS